MGFEDKFYSGGVLRRLPSLSSPPMSTLTNAELNRLRKSELIERSTELQQEWSRLTKLINTLQDGEATLQARVSSLQEENTKLEASIVELNSQAELLVRKYGEYFPSPACLHTHGW